MVATRNITSRGSAAVTMNCWPIAPIKKAHDRLRQTANADDTARQRVLDDPGEASGKHPRDRPARQRHVDHDDQHEIQGDGPTNEEARQRRLQRKGERNRNQDPDNLHSRACVPAEFFSAAVASATGRSGASTTSRDSSDAKATDGRTTMAPNPPPTRSIDSI